MKEKPSSEKKEMPKFKSVQQLYSYIEEEARRQVRRLLEESRG